MDGYLNIDKELQCFEESDSNYDDGIIEGKEKILYLLHQIWLKVARAKF